MMADPTGETSGVTLSLDFDLRPRPQFRGAMIASDAGLLAYADLNDALGLTAFLGRHAFVGLLRHSVFMLLAARQGFNRRRTTVP